VLQSDRSPLKRSLSSRVSTLSSSCSSSSVSTSRRPSLRAVGDVVASRRLVSPPPPLTLPSCTAAADSGWSACGVVVLPRCLERLLAVDSVGVRSAMDRSLVKVHLANGCFNVFKCSDSTTVKVLPVPVSVGTKLSFVEPGHIWAHSPSPSKAPGISYQGTMKTSMRMLKTSGGL